MWCTVQPGIRSLRISNNLGASAFQRLSLKDHPDLRELMNYIVVYRAAPGYAESANLFNISLLCEYLHETVSPERWINPILAAVLKYEVSFLYTVSPPPIPSRATWLADSGFDEIKTNLVRHCQAILERGKRGRGGLFSSTRSKGGGIVQFNIQKDKGFLAFVWTFFKAPQNKADWTGSK